MAVWFAPLAPDKFYFLEAVPRDTTAYLHRLFFGGTLACIEEVLELIFCLCHLEELKLSISTENPVFSSSAGSILEYVPRLEASFE